MEDAFSFHLEEDLLERYPMGKLTETELERLEEHLFICPACQARLKETNEYLSAIQAALRKLRDEPLSYSHRTDEGVIELCVTLSQEGKWIALLSGGEIGRFETVQEANQSLLRTFALKASKHQCGEGCGPKNPPR